MPAAPPVSDRIERSLSAEYAGSDGALADILADGDLLGRQGVGTRRSGCGPPPERGREWRARESRPQP